MSQPNPPNPPNHSPTDPASGLANDMANDVANDVVNDASSAAADAAAAAADTIPASLAGLGREQIRQRIAASSRDAVILADMQRLGFWPTNQSQPSPAEQLIAREAELNQQLQQLGAQLRAVQDPHAALLAMRKERMAKAREQREATRQQRAQQRFARAQHWQQRQQGELLYLGAGVSQGLNQDQSDAEKLARAQLPLLHDAAALAQAMGITLAELRFLAYERPVSRISHYRQFAMAKKTGGQRLISAPMPRLKRAQYWVLDNILRHVPLHPAAHGFVPGRSIVSNAAPHVGQAVVINLDLKNFFPSIEMPRIKGVFRMLGYSEQLASTLALLCTQAATEQVSVDGESFFVAQGARVLPQGAPSSPALTNILCKRLDSRLAACAAKLGFGYTRYADDLSFSGPPAARKLAGKLLWRVKQIIADEGFTPHPDKQHVMTAGARQSVTGIVVNQRPAIAKDTLRRFRATLYQVERDGPHNKQWNGNPNVLAALQGYAQFIRMVDPAKGTPLLLRAIAARHKWAAAELTPASAAESPAASAAAYQPAHRPARHNSAFRALAAQGKAPWTNWWQPAAKPAPVLEKTPEQLKQEKQALAAARAGNHAGKNTSTGQPKAGPGRNSRTASAAPLGGTSSPPPWPVLALQACLGLGAALLAQSTLVLVASGLLLYATLKTRQPNWIRFCLILYLAILLGKNG
jgi:retron-type reverse transcriptase